MPASSSARRFHSPESSPNHSNIHSWVPSRLVANPSRDTTILRTTFRSLIPVQTGLLARTHRAFGDSGLDGGDASPCDPTTWTWCSLRADGQPDALDLAGLGRDVD